MEPQISITVASLDEAAAAIAAIEKFRGVGLAPPIEPATVSSPLADRIYAALNTSTFTKPGQVITRVLLESPPAEQVPLSTLADAFIAEGLAKDHDEAWHRCRAAVANLSWLMRERLPVEDMAGFGKPIDVFAVRSLDQGGKRLYRLSEAGRAAAERYFKT